jgi:hypothetical protein
MDSLIGRCVTVTYIGEMTVSFTYDKFEFSRHFKGFGYFIGDADKENSDWMLPKIYMQSIHRDVELYRVDGIKEHDEHLAIGFPNGQVMIESWL